MEMNYKQKILTLFSFFIFSIVLLIFSYNNLHSGCEQYKYTCYAKWDIPGEICYIGIVNTTDGCYSEGRGILPYCNRPINSTFICYSKRYTADSNICPLPIKCKNSYYTLTLLFSIIGLAASIVLMLFLIIDYPNLIRSEKMQYYKVLAD